jgi:hypothetical protein
MAIGALLNLLVFSKKKSKNMPLILFKLQNLCRINQTIKSARFSLSLSPSLSLPGSTY